MSKYICLSGGHGGTDSGAVGNGYKERDLTIELAKLIDKELKASYTGFTSKVIQEKDSNANFRSQSSYGTATGFYMSIHFNSNSGTPGTGTEILQGKYGSSRCKTINNVLSKYFKNRGIKKVDTDSYYMLREAEFDMIAEICFINNSSDMKTYQANKTKIAKDLAAAIATSEGLTKKDEPDKYYFSWTAFTRYTQTITDGGSHKGKASGMLTATRDTYLYSTKDCTHSVSKIKKGDKFISLGNCGDGTNSKDYYTHRVITDGGLYWAVYKKVM